MSSQAPWRRAFTLLSCDADSQFAHSLLLRVDQFTLPTSETSEPIPTPAGKQFVVDKSVRTANEERAARELFWYREAFLDSLMATWHEVRCCSPISLTYVILRAQIGTLRHGVISLRNLRLTRPMLDVLKPPLLTICLEAPETTAGQVLVDEHFVIRAKIEHEAGALRFSRWRARLISYS